MLQFPRCHKSFQNPQQLNLTTDYKRKVRSMNERLLRRKIMPSGNRKVSKCIILPTSRSATWELNVTKKFQLYLPRPPVVHCQQTLHFVDDATLSYQNRKLRLAVKNGSKRQKHFTAGVRKFYQNVAQKKNFLLKTMERKFQQVTLSQNT